MIFHDSIFDMFGGVRPMARDLGEPSSNVATWKRKGRIPAEKQPHVLAVGQSLGLPITAENVVFPLGVPADAQCGLGEHAAPAAVVSAHPADSMVNFCNLRSEMRESAHCCNCNCNECSAGGRCKRNKSLCLRRNAAVARDPICRNNLGTGA